MNEVKLPVETLNAVLAYLGNRPYQEVFNIVKLIQETAKKLEEEENGTKEMDEKID